MRQKKDVRGGEMREYRKQNWEEQIKKNKKIKKEPTQKKNKADTTWVKKRHEDRRGGKKAEQRRTWDNKRKDMI